jgi:hypothetical protein
MEGKELENEQTILKADRQVFVGAEGDGSVNHRRLPASSFWEGRDCGRKGKDQRGCSLKLLSPSICALELLHKLEAALE